MKVKERGGVSGVDGFATGMGVAPVACLLELQKLLGSLAELRHLLLVRHILLVVRMLLQLLHTFL